MLPSASRCSPGAPQLSHRQPRFRGVVSTSSCGVRSSGSFDFLSSTSFCPIPCTQAIPRTAPVPKLCLPECRFNKSNAISQKGGLQRTPGTFESEDIGFQEMGGNPAVYEKTMWEMMMACETEPLLQASLATAAPTDPGATEKTLRRPLTAASLFLPLPSWGGEPHHLTVNFHTIFTLPGPFLAPFPMLRAFWKAK